MKIYLKYEDVGSENTTMAPVSIGLTPFKKDCYYIDLGNKKINDLVLFEGEERNPLIMPYNVEISEKHLWQIRKTKQLLTEEEFDELPEDLDLDDYDEGDMVDVYKNGKLVSSKFVVA